MANGIFNIAKGREIEFALRVANSDPTNAVLVIVLLQASSEADATLEDYDTLGALLGGSNTEADFTNYARIELSDSDISAPSPDDTNNWYAFDIDDQTWTSAGGASNNTLDKLLICYDPDSTGGDDTNITPIAHYDFDATTDGSNLIAQINASGLWRVA